MALTTIKSSSFDSTSPVISPSLCDNISNMFDGSRTVFPLTVSQTSINTVTDSKDVTVILNGRYLEPYVKEITYPWISEYDSSKGYRVTGSNLCIYNAPDASDTCIVMITGASQTAQTRKYPFSPTTIALGL